MRRRRNSLGLVVGVLAVLMSVPSIVGGLNAGNTTEVETSLAFCIFGLLIIAVLVYQRGAPEDPEETLEKYGWAHLKWRALLAVGLVAAINVGFVVLALGEAVGKHRYGWLILVPVAAWSLWILTRALLKITRSSPEELGISPSAEDSD